MPGYGQALQDPGPRGAERVEPVEWEPVPKDQRKVLAGAWQELLDAAHDLSQTPFSLVPILELRDRRLRVVRAIQALKEASGPGPKLS